MAKPQKQSIRIPLPFGGIYSGGNRYGTGTTAQFDPAQVPDGKSYDVENFVHRPGRWETSPQWAATSLTSGVAEVKRWEDNTNGTARLVAYVTNGANLDLYLQDSGANTFPGVATASVAATSVADATDYRGRQFFATDTAICAFDGSSVTSNALGGETIYADSLATFIDRIFLGRVHVSIANQLTVAQSYDPTASWATINVTAEKVTNGTSIIGRLTPTNTTTASLYLKDIYTVAAATKDTFLRYWCDLRNTSAVYAVPVKIEVYYSQIWVAGATYAVGHIRVPTTAGGNGYRYRVTSITTGVAAGVEPTWPTTVGTTVVDGGVTWICDGTDACGSTESAAGGLVIPNISDEPNFTRTSVLARIAPNPQSTKVGLRIVFGNSGSPTYTLTSLEMSLRDGKTDGDLNKANRGQQLTVGRFGYDFFNQESSTTATVAHDDRVYWTETADPNDLRGNNYFQCQDIAGRITAIRSIAGRLVVFKQRGMWVFAGTDNPDIPIRLERFYRDIGCRGPIAVDAFEDHLYFISPFSEIFEWAPGSDPRPLAGDAMREALINPAGFAVTSLTVDGYQKELWLCAEGSVVSPIFAVYNMRTDEWYRRTTFSGTSTKRVLYSPGGAVVYGWNASSGGQLYILNGATTGDPSVTFTAIWTPRYIEGPPHSDIFVKELWLRYVRPAGACTMQVVTNYLTGGTLIQKTLVVSLPVGAGSRAVPIPVFQRGDRFAFTFTFTPTATDSKFAITSCEADCDIIPGNPPLNPTYVSGAL